jgi:formylmethanofuran dehydrogenase subunit B
MVKLSVARFTTAAPEDASASLIKVDVHVLRERVLIVIDITVKDNTSPTPSAPACSAKAWFTVHHADDRPSCLIDGRPASVAEGVERAARILTDAKYPIVYGLSDTTSEAQRVAVAIGDAIAGTVDTTTSVCHGPSAWRFRGRRGHLHSRRNRQPR